MSSHNNKLVDDDIKLDPGKTGMNKVGCAFSLRILPQCHFLIHPSVSNVYRI